MNHPVNAVENSTFFGAQDAPVELEPDSELEADLRLSAWFDGEPLPGVSPWHQVSPQEAQRRWATYQLVGLAMREPLAASGTQLSASSNFLASVMAGIGGDVPSASGQPTPMVRSQPVAVVPTFSAVAANDGVYRWKWAAGLASTVAALAVAWGLLGQAPLVGGESHLASVPATGLASSGPVTVAVPTRGGVLLRDPDLEALVQAHRQQGALVGLQMPNGFLRNATFEESPR